MQFYLVFCSKMNHILYLFQLIFEIKLQKTSLIDEIGHLFAEILADNEKG